MASFSTRIHRRAVAIKQHLLEDDKPKHIEVPGLDQKDLIYSERWTAKTIRRSYRFQNTLRVRVMYDEVTGIFSAGTLNEHMAPISPIPESTYTGPSVAIVNELIDRIRQLPPSTHRLDSKTTTALTLDELLGPSFRRPRAEE